MWQLKAKRILFWARLAVLIPVLMSGLALLQPARAEVVSGLYQAQILVPGQADSFRQQAARDGLAQVLVKVSGHTGVVDDPLVQQVLASANGWLESFRYESSDQIIDYKGSQVQASRLVLNFSAKAVDGFLRRHQLPIWPANRPAILIWPVEDSAELGRFIPSSVESPELLQRLLAQAGVAGLPVTLPIMDLQDRVAVSAEQLWNRDQEAILQASARYPADAILVVRYSRTSSGRVLSTWWLYHKGQQQVFDSQSEADGDWVQQGVAQVAVYLASIYAIVANGEPSTGVTMSVAEVNNFADYRKVLDYLNGLVVIKKLSLLSVQCSEMTLQLETEGDTDLLLDALALDKKLVQASVVVDSQAVVAAVPASSDASGGAGNGFSESGSEGNGSVGNGPAGDAGSGQPAYVLTPPVTVLKYRLVH